MISSAAISHTHLGDNMEYMRSIPDNYFDIAVTDPPYGINAEQGTNRAARKQFKDKKYGWDSKIPEQEYFDELQRVSRHQIIWGGNYFLDYLGKCRCFIIWDKLNPDRCFADCEMAWTSFDEVARIYKEKRVQELNRLDEGKIHPTQKPVRLYHWTYKRYATREQLDVEGRNIRLFDSHLGSGSARIAAHLLGIDFYSCEISPDYYEVEQTRFKKYIDSYGVFAPVSSNIEIPKREILDLSSSTFTLD